jgi:hypothetical protein
MGLPIKDFGPFTKLEFADDEAGPAQVIMGRLTILGTDHHAYFIRLHGGEGIEGEPELQQAVADPYDRLADFSRWMDQASPFETMEIPGIPGRWAMFVHPYET